MFIFLKATSNDFSETKNITEAECECLIANTKLPRAPFVSDFNLLRMCTT
jgi:hypothetical protein